VPDVTIRHAGIGDISQLVEMRRALTLEDEDFSADRPGYEGDCTSFLEEAIRGGRWHIWVATIGAMIVATMFVELVDKVPRPVPEHRHIAYLTNCYTRPECRGQGIGTRLLEHAQDAARAADAELMLVWPSQRSVEFYRRAGFEGTDEPLTWVAG
jgi:ribosomal protein S18 acetylase RimI-like enzyme